MTAVKSRTALYLPDIHLIFDYSIAKRFNLFFPSDQILRDAGYVGHVYVLVSDYIVIFDSVISGSQNVVNVADLMGLLDSGNKLKTVYILVKDTVLTLESFSHVNRGLKVSETIYSIDYGSLKTLNTVSVYDNKLISDVASYARTYYQISVRDVISINDYVAYTKTYSPILFTMLAYRVRYRYQTLSISDYKFIYDYISVYKNKNISVLDKMGYDYVPSMDPNSIHYMSIYPNPTTYGTLVSDYGIFYDSATARRPYKPVVVLDVIGVKDGISMAKRSVAAYDKLVADNATLNRV